MPGRDLTASELTDAEDTLDSAELGYASRQDGVSESEDFTVIKQGPAAGNLLPINSKVTLVLRVPKIGVSVGGNVRHATITYTVPDGSFDIEQVTNAGVPWSILRSK
jgi:beta-lactam-binding protein with PASTA domain